MLAQIQYRETYQRDVSRSSNHGRACVSVGCGRSAPRFPHARETAPAAERNCEFDRRETAECNRFEGILLMAPVVLCSGVHSRGINKSSVLYAIYFGRVMIDVQRGIEDDRIPQGYCVTGHIDLFRSIAKLRIKESGLEERRREDRGIDHYGAIYTIWGDALESPKICIVGLYKYPSCRCMFIFDSGENGRVLHTCVPSTETERVLYVRSRDKDVIVDEREMSTSGECYTRVSIGSEAAARASMVLNKRESRGQFFYSSAVLAIIANNHLVWHCDGTTYGLEAAA
jgi:hypothetical protein